MKVPSVLRTSSPWAGPSTRAALNESPSMSTSLERTLPDSELSSVMEKVSSVATTVSSTGLMMMRTSAGALGAMPSDAE